MCAHHERRAATTRDGDEGSMVLSGNRAFGKVAPRAAFAQKAPAEEFPNLGLCHAIRMQTPVLHAGQLRDLFVTNDTDGVHLDIPVGRLFFETPSIGKRDARLEDRCVSNTL
jgi:hypothetical protein